MLEPKEHMAQSGLGLGEFEARIGFEFGPALQDPAEVLDWNVDFLRWLCRELALDWPCHFLRQSQKSRSREAAPAVIETARWGQRATFWLRPPAQGRGPGRSSAPPAPSSRPYGSGGPCRCLVDADALHRDGVALLHHILGAAHAEVGQLADVAEAFFAGVHSTKQPKSFTPVTRPV